MITAPIDLKARAHQAMIDAGFRPDFPADVLQSVPQLQALERHATAPGIQDLRPLLWSSIDNDTSRDLDQIEYVEKLADGTCRLLVGIADVDLTIAKSTAPDRQAAFETTSVYTGVATFPMLPSDFSTDSTSLLSDQDRRAVVIELRVLETGEVTDRAVYPALVRNRAKLAYNSTGAWLEGN